MCLHDLILICVLNIGTELKDKVVWITGASSGIGESLVKELVNLNAGVKVVLSARRADELERVKRECIGMITYPSKIGPPYIDANT